MASPDPEHVLRGHTTDVQSLAFLSEEHLFAGDSNGEVRLWDLASCRTEYAVRLHDANAGVLQLVCLPSYGILVSQGRDGNVKLWAAGRTSAIDRPQPLHEIRSESFNFCRCAVWAPLAGSTGESAPPAPEDTRSPGARGGAAADLLRDVLVACVENDPADIGLWRPAEGPSAGVHLRQGPASGGVGGIDGSGTQRHGMCMSLAFLSPSPQPLPTSPSLRETTISTTTTAKGISNSSSISTSHAAAPPALNTAGPFTAAPGGGVSQAAGAATGPRFVAAGYEDGVVALWDLRSPGRPLGSLRVHNEPVMCLDVRARTRDKGRRRREVAAAAGAAAPAVEADAEAEQRIRGAPAGDSTEVYDLVSGSADDKISCCEVRPAAAQPLVPAQQLRLREAGSADMCIRRDGRMFAAACWDGRVRLYSLRRREPLAVLKYHRSQVTAVAFSPETNKLASASQDTTIALWSVFADTAVQQ